MMNYLTNYVKANYYRLNNNKLLRLVGCRIKANRPIFKTKMLTCQ